MNRPGTSRVPRWLLIAGVAVVLAGLIGGGLGLFLPRGSSTANAAPASILGWTPGIARGVPPAAPLTVYFSRGMDHPSVESAWRMSPAVTGTFDWSDTSVSFRPSRPLRPGTYYRLSLGRGARDDQGKRVRNALTAAFTTGDDLKIVSFTPASGTDAVPTNGLIAITFNHPMVALAGLDANVLDPPNWSVSISPQTPGHGSWLGTSTWVFHPDGGLIPSADYSVSLPATITDTWGDPLRAGATWRFRTVRPEILAQTPANGERLANPDGTIHVSFNQPMDHASTARAFSLRGGGAPVSGDVSWSGNTLVFHPSSPLDPAKAYNATVSTEARSANGVAALGTAAAWSFHVAHPPEVISSTPKEGASASGGVELQFSAPMDQASLDHHLTVSPALGSQYTYDNSSGGKASNDLYEIGGDFKPSTAYTVTISAGAKDIYGRLLAAPFTLQFTSAPLPPSAILYGLVGFQSAIAFSAGRVVDAPVQLVNVPQAHYTLEKVGINQIGSGYYYGSFTAPPGTMIREWTQAVSHPLNGIENLGVPVARADGSPLPPGLYWLGVQAVGAARSNPPATSAEAVVASNVSVTLKSGTTRTLVWVTSPDTGKPIAGVPVHLLDNNEHTIATVTSDSNGIALFHSGGQQGTPSALVDDGTHFGLAEGGWQPTIRLPYANVDANGLYLAPPNGTYVYTDRPIYRPDQIVHFRAMLWKDNDGLYAPYHGAVPASAQDGAGHGIYRATLTPDRFGAVRGEFRIPANAATGYSGVNLNFAGQTPTGNFQIAEYRKPEFLTAVTATRPNYVQGQTIDATVSVKYVFGAPVAGQQVDWIAYRQPLESPPPGWDEYQFGDQDALQLQYLVPESPGGGSDSTFGAQFAQGSGATDAQGKLSIHLPVDLSGLGADQTITIETTTTDINSQSVSGRVQVAAHKASFGIGLAGPGVTQTAQPATAGVAAVRPDGTAIAGQSLHVTVYRRTYNSELAATGFGTTYWKEVPHDTAISAQDLTTDSHGKASVSFTPSDGGEYYVVAEGTDSFGNTARSGISVYASATALADFGASSDTVITLKPDKSVYKVGDTAHLLVAAPFGDASALVTVERGDIREYHVEHLASNSSTVDVPITLSDLPNVFVSVTVYRGQRTGSPADWRYGLTELHVNVDPKRLVVHLAQDRSHYHPGGTVTYTIRTADTGGRPVSAELSLALVDTAVLALQDELNPDIVRALYGERPLEVSTASDGVISIDHLSQKPGFRLQLRGGFGGGGGGSPAQVYARLPSQQATTVRKHFEDTGFWSADVLTDSSGQATIRVPLPDNLTTWRMDARGITADQRVGQDTLDTLSTQDIVLRPVTPRFFLQGDSLRVGTIVNNTLPAPISADVSLAATGLTIHGDSKTSVTVPAQGERLVLWNVDVRVADSAQLTLRADPTTGGVQGDAVAVTLPVHPPLTDETVATSGQTFASDRQLVIVPDTAAPRPGALSVEISSSLTAGMGAAYSSLRPVQYESNDDISSRVLAAASLHSVPESVVGLSATGYSALPADVDAGVSRLLTDQLGDGGWPWFNGAGSQSAPIITADVMGALSAATSRPGVPAALARGAGYVRARLNSVPAGERAYLLATLAESGAGDTAATKALYDDSIARAQLDPQGVADLALALAGTGDTAHARALASDLDGHAMVSATGAHWEGGISADPITATIRALAALLRVQPSDPFVPAAARWLMLARSGNAWDCSRDTAMALHALATYAQAAQEGTARYSYSVAVDGTERVSGRYTPANQTGTSGAEIPVADLHRGGQSDLTITRQPVNGNLGPGPLYWVARLRYYLHADAIPARDEGVAVGRRYLDLKGQPITSAQAGSVVQVELTVTTTQTLLYLDTEDPIPAGLEAIDQSLNTSQQGLFAAWQRTPAGSTSLQGYLSHVDLRDDRVSLYVQILPPGSYTYSYLARATVAGRYGVAPAHAEEAFFPEVFGRSAGQTFTVQ